MSKLKGSAKPGFGLANTTRHITAETADASGTASDNEEVQSAFVHTADQASRLSDEEGFGSSLLREQEAQRV